MNKSCSIRKDLCRAFRSMNKNPEKWGDFLVKKRNSYNAHTFNIEFLEFHNLELSVVKYYTYANVSCVGSAVLEKPHQPF